MTVSPTARCGEAPSCSLCLAYPLPPRPRHCLCLAFPLPPRLRHCLSLPSAGVGNLRAAARAALLVRRRRDGADGRGRAVAAGGGRRGCEPVRHGHRLSLVFSLPFFAKTVPFRAVLQRYEGAAVPRPRRRDDEGGGLPADRLHRNRRGRAGRRGRRSVAGEAQLKRWHGGGQVV